MARLGFEKLRARRQDQTSLASANSGKAGANNRRRGSPAETACLLQPASTRIIIVLRAMAIYS